MRIASKLLLGAMGISALTACTNESFEGFGGKETGVAQLNINIKNPESKNPETRAITETSDFPVNIYNAQGEKVLSYEAASLIPEKVTMEVGNYTVESNTPGIIRKTMTEPYYRGVESMEILKGVTTNAEVICKMQNSLISISYGSDFREVFTSWEITVSDNIDTNYGFTHNSGSSIYLYFGEEGAKELTINFRGVTTEGSTIASRSKLTKNQADESYDDDRENFTGGDALKLNFTPTEATDGKITGIGINADVVFEETTTDVIVEVIDKPGLEEGGGTEEPIDPTPGEDNAITLNLPADMTVSGVTDPALGNTYIKADNGLKSIKVKISSTSDEMISSLQDLSAGYGVDFIAGAEVVENQNLVNLFTSLNQTLSVPNEGDKEYTFPIGNFFKLLVFLAGDHTFDLIITDMSGNTKSGKLVLTVE